MTKSRGILSPRKKWTAAEDAELRRIYPDTPSPVIAAALGVSVTVVYSRASKFRLHKSDAFMASGLSGRIRNGLQHPSMIATRFKKGNVPWIKGKHYVAGGRSAETRFKRGHKGAPRWDQETYIVGALRINTDGGLEIKMHDGHRPWVPLSHYTWFLHTGKWPRKGYCLRCRDGDPYNTNPAPEHAAQQPAYQLSARSGAPDPAQGRDHPAGQPHRKGSPGMSTNIEQLREHLMETLAELRNKDKPMEVDRARAIAQVAGVLVDTARVEVEFIKATGADDSKFIRVEDKTPPAPGVLGSTVHKLR